MRAAQASILHQRCALATTLPMDTTSHGVGQIESGSGTLPSAQAQDLSEPGFVWIGALMQIILNQQKR